MAFSIAEFTKALDNAGARASLFEVTLTQGPTLTATAETEVKIATDLSFTCRATTIPGLTVTPITVQYFGREIKTPGEMEFADWSVTILNDNNQRVRRTIERWMASINHHSDNKLDKDFMTSTTDGVYPWTGTAKVTQYDKKGDDTHHYKMKNCWPTSLDPIDLSYDSTGTIQEYGITFALDYWEYEVAT